MLTTTSGCGPDRHMDDQIRQLSSPRLVLPDLLSALAAALSIAAALLIVLPPRDGTAGAAARPGHDAATGEQARAGGSMRALQPGVAFARGDLYAQPADSAAACAALCAGDARCRAMSYALRERQCRIKDRVLDAVPMPDHVSAIRRMSP